MAEPRHGGRAAGSGGFWGWWTVAVFLLLYVFSFVDRGIIGMMVQPLERDLHITDVQLSLLTGPAFSLFYAVCSLPIGYLMDRLSRRWLTAAGVLVWGAATCLCGLAGSLAQLMVARMGVGVGESVMTPAAHSLIAEQFPPKRLSLPISVFTMGAVVGGGIALALGGVVVQLVSHSPPVRLPLVGDVRAWQLAFLAVGLPTMVLSLLPLTVREQRRPARLAAQAQTAADGPSFFRTHWRIVWLGPLGFAMTNVIVASLLGWTPTFMIRVYHWNPGQIGITFGLIGLIAGSIGQLGGAAIVDWLYARGVKDAHARYHIAGLAITAPTLIAGIYSGSPYLFMAATALFQCVTYPYIGYAAAALQLYAPSQVRGRISSIFLACITIVGSLGPFATAFVAEHVLHDKAGIGRAIGIVTAVAAPIGILILWQFGRALKAAASASRSAEPILRPGEATPAAMKADAPAP